jgi:hypothetical protein
MTADKPTLHARLTREIDDHIAGYDMGDQIGHGYHALRAVIELHKPQDTWSSGVIVLGPALCFGCDFDGYDGEHPEWPCRTIEAIARELGINAEEDRRA